MGASMRIYILSTYREQGAEDVKATINKDNVEKLFMSYLPTNDEIIALREFLVADEVNPDGFNLSKGWGGYMLHIIESEELI
jgi:hypothetical protein